MEWDETFCYVSVPMKLNQETKSGFTVVELTQADLQSLPKVKLKLGKPLPDEVRRKIQQARKALETQTRLAAGTAGHQ